MTQVSHDSDAGRASRISTITENLRHCGAVVPRDV